jgi:hypothetical protein
MKKAPAPTKTQGAYEQTELFDRPALSPALPEPYSKSWLALMDLSEGAITQVDWLNIGRGWRLAAAIKDLGYRGWPVCSEWVQVGCWPRPIKRYYLSDAGLSIAAAKLRRVAH